MEVTHRADVSLPSVFKNISDSLLVLCQRYSDCPMPTPLSRNGTRAFHSIRRKQPPGAEAAHEAQRDTLTIVPACSRRSSVVLLIVGLLH